MRVCLVRHGETEWNRLGRIQGREDIPLSPAGIAQARSCGEALRCAPWHRLYSSPLMRAVQTAKEIAAVIGLQDIRIENGLIERDYGAASGTTKAQRDAHSPNDGFAGMEDWDTLSARVLDCVLRLCGQSKGEPLLLVSHGAAINSLLAKLTDHAIGTGKTKLHNGAINLLAYADDRLFVRAQNLRPAEAARYLSGKI